MFGFQVFATIFAQKTNLTCCHPHTFFCNLFNEGRVDHGRLSREKKNTDNVINVIQVWTTSCEGAEELDTLTKEGVARARGVMRTCAQGSTSYTFFLLPGTFQFSRVVLPLGREVVPRRHPFARWEDQNVEQRGHTSILHG